MKLKIEKRNDQMKFKCGKLKLAGILTNVQKAVAQRSPIPALEGVLITCQNNTATLCSYNNELGITTSMEANIQNEGKIVINAHLLTEIIKKLPSDTVEIESTENLTVHIRGGQSNFELVGIDSKEFPTLPNIPESESLSIPVDTLKSMIKQTIFAVADTDSKPVHTGTLFELKDKLLTLVSVDGYRLALRSEIVEEDIELKFVVPGKTLKEILRLIPQCDIEEGESIRIAAGMRHIIFNVGKYSIISRLLEGEFLDYRATIPEKSEVKVKISTIKLISSIERVSLLISDRLKSPVRCTFSQNSAYLSCTTLVGKSSDEIPCSSNLTEDLEIAFNNKYMLDALKNTDADEIEIHLNGSLSPIKIVPKEGKEFLFLVLPVRVKAD